MTKLQQIGFNWRSCTITKKSKKAEWLEKGANPRFLVTNLEIEAQELGDDFYVQRGATSEHRIKEFKVGLNGRSS